MTDKYVCEKCGTEMVNRSSKYSVVVECPKCGWGWATTSYDPTDDDNTEYEIWLLPGNVQTMETMRLIAHIASINYLQSKKMLESETPVMLYKACHEAVANLNKVQRIQDIAKKLNGSNIRFFVVPEFPYEL